MNSPLRGLPSVDRLLRHPSVAALQQRIPAERLVAHSREVIERARHRIGTGGAGAEAAPDFDALALQVVGEAEAALAPSLRPAINATGVVIHTNLGRAPLSDAARAAMEAVTRSYSNLEYDLEAGERGSRLSHLDRLLRDLLGAEDSLVVNNNASALFIVLSAFAAQREVIVSRGQAVEIGGGFRIPDVLRESGARLVEVGTTNRTRASDYRSAAGPETAALLRVHTSNFKIVGFTEQPALPELRAIADETGVLLLDDLGSGCLLETTTFGMEHEPMPRESLAAGADLVMFSGDKLLGGPQAGIIAGRGELIGQLRRHPLARALRTDKATLAALAATLRHYVLDEAITAIPVWRMIAAEADDLRRRAEAWRVALDEGEVVESRSMIGGGALPEEGRPTYVLRLRPARQTVEAVAARLRQAEPAVVARIEHDAVLLDPRTVAADEDGALIEALRSAIRD